MLLIQESLQSKVTACLTQTSIIQLQISPWNSYIIQLLNGTTSTLDHHIITLKMACMPTRNMVKCHSMQYESIFACEMSPWWKLISHGWRCTKHISCHRNSCGFGADLSKIGIQALTRSTNLFAKACIPWTIMYVM